MAQKLSSEQIEQFYAALPEDKRILRPQMFGMRLAKVGDYHFAGRSGQGVMVRVSEAQRNELLAKGGTPWEPMPGKPRPDLVVLPDSLADDPKLLTLWVRRAFEHCLALPPKPTKRAKKKAPAARSKPKSGRARSQKR